MNAMTLLALVARPELHMFALAHARNHRDILRREEAVSAADEGLVEACRRYQPEKGPFMPFARLWVVRELNRAIALELRWRRRMVCELGDIPEPFELPSDQDTAIARGQFERLLGDESFRLWVRHKEDGDTLRELARVYQLSLRQIRNRIKKAGATVRFHANASGDELWSRRSGRRSVKRILGNRRPSGRW